MELRHIRYFTALADRGSVSSAAELVHITQPALSRQLRGLERELGVVLFERSAGKLTLSRTGRQLLPRARELLSAAEALRADAAFHASGDVRQLTIAAPTVTLTDVVSPFVATMTPLDPVVDVRSADGRTATVMLEQGADIAIDIRKARTPFVSHELAVLPVWAYVPRGHILAGKKKVTLEELFAHPVIGLPRTFTAREALDSAVSANGGDFTSFLEAANGTIAQALAASGRGVAVVSDDARFDLQPIAIGVGDATLAVRLVASWDGRSIASNHFEDLTKRLSAWVRLHYQLT